MEEGDGLETLEVSHPGLDLKGTFAEFKQQTGDDDPNHFLDYLRDQGVITQAEYRNAHARQGMDIEAEGDPLESEERYRTIGELGEGAMGQVFVARDKQLRRKVAYKQLKRQRGTPRIIVERFVSEAQITAQLDHPNIVPVYSLEVGPRGEMAFAMKLVQGIELEDFIRECQERVAAGQELKDEYSLAGRLEQFLKVCDAISYSHDKGVIHRDLKPANIMLGRFNEVYVMDWGIARLLDQPDTELDPEELVQLGYAETDDPTRTRAGQIVGTPQFMSPEQARGLNDLLTPASDQFALGAILYELVSLERAFKGKNLLELVTAVATAKKEPLEGYLGKVPIPRQMRGIIDKAMAFEPIDRYPSVRALADDIRRFLRGVEVHASPDTPLQKLVRVMGRHKLLTLLVFMGILLISAGITIWSLAEQRAALAEARTQSEEARQKEEALRKHEQAARKKEHLARIRENRLMAYQTAVAGQMHVIDTRFMAYEARLQGLVAAAGSLLETGMPGFDMIYSNTDFGTPGKGPPDLAMSPLYKKQLSIDWPVYKLAPGVTLATVEPKIRRLLPLRHHYKRMFVASGVEDTPFVGEERVRELLTVTGAPLRWAYVGLVEGVMFSYPGKTGYPPPYDPRIRPWYKLAANKYGVFWGNAYIDLQGQGFIMPCVSAMYARDGRFLGVAGIELTFDHIIAELMHLEHPGVKETFLVDPEGRVVVRSSDLDKEFAGGVMHEALKRKPFHLAAVAEAIRDGRTGVEEVEGEDGESLQVAFFRLSTLGWTYVAVAPSAELFAENE